MSKHDTVINAEKNFILRQIKGHKVITETPCRVKYSTSDAVVDTAEIKRLLEGLQVTAILQHHCPLAAFVPLIQMLPFKHNLTVSVDQFYLTQR
jgi:hypothetical protein